MRETERETHRERLWQRMQEFWTSSYSEIQTWPSVSASLFGKSTQAHNGSTWLSSLSVSLAVSGSVSLTLDGGCDDRTWEPSLSHVKEELPLFENSFSFCVFFFFVLFFFWVSHVIPTSEYRICRLFSMVYLSFFGDIFSGFVRLKRRGSKFVLEIQSLIFVESVILICFV